MNLYIFSVIQHYGLAGALVLVLSIIIAVTFHEFAHAWTADRLGDDTPRLMGRVTLSPAAHLDPLGSLLFLVAGFGWGKPVIYNPMRLSRRTDELLIALAGPISNLILAVVFNALAYISIRNGSNLINPEFLYTVASINVLLAAFNMIPIPPLDGSSIIAYFWPEYRSVFGAQIGLIILLIVVFLPLVNGQSILSLVIQPIIAGFSQLTTLFGILG
jgi:Zn-dependent protease